ncbi:MAG: PASTA domain-containing protein [Erysipelotrichaceae bacterium]|nr:PASTA domain-containing protein [Erysipelotrichaceae bacterium]MDD3923791.1 PASTA domain-containing protein [Erysipelotrichaceae bacterium]MDD4642419.1 PASTA domain-containing protein [Erysipelotrichaceae bacterium]
MAENKDFLGSLAQEVDQKPDSFKEEKVEKIHRPSPFSPKNVIIVLIILAIIASGTYLLFFKPNITMQNFVGSKISEFTAWARQNDIDSQGVLLVEEYNFEVAEDVIISQDIAEGEKIRKDAKLTITVSLGADPDESVAFVDIKALDLSAINEWIAENKLLNTRVTTTYDDIIPEDQVISYDLKNIDESEFTRGSTLTIVVSKGPKPAATITVTTDYVDQAYSLFKSWADDNKLVIDMSEAYDSKIALGNIVSLSIAKNDKVKEGDTIKVVVSKGPAVKMIYLDAYTRERVTDWAAANNVTVRFKEVYHATIAEDVVVYQSITSGTLIKDDSILYVGISLGKPRLSQTSNVSIETLKAEIATLNENGANLSIDPTYTYEINETVAAGNIVRISNLSSLTVGTKLSLVISKGKNVLLSTGWNSITIGDTTEEEIRTLCVSDDLTCKITYQTAGTNTIGTIASVKINDTDTTPVGGNYLTQLDVINVYVYANNVD